MTISDLRYRRLRAFPGRRRPLIRRCRDIVLLLGTLVLLLGTFGLPPGGFVLTSIGQPAGAESGQVPTRQSSGTDPAGGPDSESATDLAAPLDSLVQRDPEGWIIAHPNHAWSFPQDHWPHPGYKTEWWYLTGILRTGTGRELGYQFTFFRVGLVPERPALASSWSAANLIMGHASISDLENQEHLFTEVLHREVPFLGGFSNPPDSLIAWSLGPPGTATRWTLRWNGAGFDFEIEDRKQGVAFELSTRPTEPLVFQGPNGYSRKGHDPGSASHYYSFPRLRTSGTVRLGKEDLAVEGESWMDHEFLSNQLTEEQVGWDWFSLRLKDGREVMLYLLRDAKGALDFGRGTLVGRDGEVRYLEPPDWELEATRRWKSPETAAEYPAGWSLEIPSAGLRLRIEPRQTNQENVSRFGGLFYWEGAVSVIDAESDQPAGEGYVELTGYGPGNRPPI